MKLRIRGDSLRLRVTRTELEAMAEAGRVEDAVNFGQGARLAYRLQASDEVDTPRARFDGAQVCVELPAADVARWTSTEEVGLRGEQKIDGARTLSILVEKDFACLAPREDEDESDMFEHPGAADGATC